MISARKGEFETGFEKGGQTREHAMLAKTAGVKHLVVLVNKMDDSTVNWSLERWVQVVIIVSGVIMFQEGIFVVLIFKVFRPELIFCGVFGPTV